MFSFYPVLLRSVGIGCHIDGRIRVLFLSSCLIPPPPHQAFLVPHKKRIPGIICKYRKFRSRNWKLEHGPE